MILFFRVRKFLISLNEMIFAAFRTFCQFYGISIDFSETTQRLGRVVYVSRSKQMFNSNVFSDNMNDNQEEMA